MLQFSEMRDWTLMGTVSGGDVQAYWANGHGWGRFLSLSQIVLFGSSGCRSLVLQWLKNPTWHLNWAQNWILRPIASSALRTRFHANLSLLEVDQANDRGKCCWAGKSRTPKFPFGGLQIPSDYPRVDLIARTSVSYASLTARISAVDKIFLHETMFWRISRSQQRP